MTSAIWDRSPPPISQYFNEIPPALHLNLIVQVPISVAGETAGLPDFTTRFDREHLLPGVNTLSQESVQEINVNDGFKDKYGDAFIQSQQLGHFTVADVVANDVEKVGLEEGKILVKFAQRLMDKDPHCRPSLPGQVDWRMMGMWGF